MDISPNDWKIMGIVTTPVLALFGLFTKHIMGSNRHPKAEDLVYNDVCEERGKTNDQAHEHLQKGIEDAMERSDEQHKELKTDMRTGFTKIETLIQGLK